MSINRIQSQSNIECDLYKPYSTEVQCEAEPTQARWLNIG